ncbi:MAG: DEAD/DEAH box helicase family protein, partial [Chloroflexi bacterium]|nr:DEAD/DEAH box helicase family protein [Chloroflexota bacterium]
MNEACVALGLAEVFPGKQIQVAVVRFQGHTIFDVWCGQLESSWSPIANPLIDRIDDSVVVGYNTSNMIEELRRQGLYLPNPTLDLAELAAILLPQESPATPTASSVEPGARGQAVAAQQRYVALVDYVLAFDRPLIEEMARLAQVASPSLAVFFREVLRAKVSLAFGDQKAAQGGVEGIVASRVLAERTPLSPLKPKADVRLLDKEALSAALQPEGIVAKSLAGYEYREPQLKMLEAVVDAFNERQHLIVEAGTGTGKSLAYLLPAMMFATQNDERVVISTNTINLQDQLFQKDIPSLQRLLPSTCEVALLKGRGNYLCLWQFAARRQRPGLSQEEAQPLLKLLAWLPQTSAGDANELALSSKERAFWPRVAATEENCVGSVCPFFRQNLCYLFRGRKQAEAAHIIVVNHALLLSDLVSGNKVLPEYRYLVVDEAHRLEEEVTEQLGYSIEQTEIRRYIVELTDG